MAVTFAVVASAAAVGGGWIVRANQVGRIVALVLLAVFGVALLFPALGDRMTRLLGWPSADSCSNGPSARAGVGGALLLGVARRVPVGAVRVPGAGPHSDGCGARGRERADDVFVAGVCGRRRHIARSGDRGGRSRVRGHEAWVGRGGVDPSHPWRRGVGRSRRRGTGRRHGDSGQAVTRQYGAGRATARRPSCGRARSVGDVRQRGIVYGRRRGRHQSHSGPERRDRLAQQRATHGIRAPRARRAPRCLDLLVHQLSADLAVCEGVGGAIRAGSGWWSSAFTRRNSRSSATQ